TQHEGASECRIKRPSNRETKQPSNHEDGGHDQHDLVAEAVDDRSDDDRRDEDAEVQHEKNIALLREIDVDAFAHFSHPEECAEGSERDAEDEHRTAGSEKE